MTVPSPVKARRRQPAPASESDISAEALIHSLHAPADDVEAGTDPPAVGFGQRLIDQRQDKALSIPILPIDLLLPTRENPRIIQDDEAMASLVGSIQTQAAAGVPGGLLQPLLVRPHPAKPGMYEVRAGERRLIAARRAGQTHLPCYVRQLDDQEAMEVTIVENLERKELHAVEEARGIQTLLAKGWDEDAIASRLNMSPSWVAKTASLTKLSDQFRDWCLNRKNPLFHAPVTLLQHIARLPADLQTVIQQDVSHELDYDRLPYYFSTVADFDRCVNERFLMLLRNVPWKLDDVALYPEGGAGAGSCERCMHRSARSPLLFDDDLDAGGKHSTDRCLLRSCFEEKSRRAIAEKVTAEMKIHGEVLVLDAAAYNDPAERVRKSWPGVLGAGQVREVSKTTAGAQPAVIVNGPGAGQRKWVVVGPLRSPRQSTRPAGLDGQPRPRPLKERRAQLEQRRKAYIVQAVREQLHTLAAGIRDQEAALPTCLRGDRWKLLSLLDAFGTAHRRDSVYEHTKPTSWKILQKHTADQDGEGKLRARLAASLFQVLENRLARADSSESIDLYYVDVVQMAKYVIEVDLEVLRREAEEKIPEPASWRNLNADGTLKAVSTGPRSTRKGRPS